MAKRGDHTAVYGQGGFPVLLIKYPGQALCRLVVETFQNGGFELTFIVPAGNILYAFPDRQGGRHTGELDKLGANAGEGNFLFRANRKIRNPVVMTDIKIFRQEPRG